MLTSASIQNALTTLGEPFTRFPLQNGSHMIATRRGARLLGPFWDEDSPCVYWVNPALATPEDLAAFLSAGEWNLGGERVWVAPEIQFNIRDRADFWGTHHIPDALDPGRYTMLAIDGVIQFHQQIALDAYNTASGRVVLDVERTVRSVPNPLQTALDSTSYMERVHYAGYAQDVTLSILGGDPMLVESWNLVQLNPGGMLVIPATDEATWNHYFGDPTPDATTVEDGAFRVQLTGQQQYKLGYKALYLSGTIAYLNTTSAQPYLLVRQFHNDPSSQYCEEPPQLPGVRGHSVHVYNDGGQFGSNGEMEANGRTIGTGTGRDTTTDTFNMWMYFSSDITQLKRIGRLLLGVPL